MGPPSVIDWLGASFSGSHFMRLRHTPPTLLAVVITAPAGFRISAVDPGNWFRLRARSRHAVIPPLMLASDRWKPPVWREAGKPAPLAQRRRRLPATEPAGQTD